MPGIMVDGKTQTGITKYEDTAHVSGEEGILLFAVRNDDDAVLAGTKLDKTPLSTDGKGHLLLASSAQADLETTHQNAVLVTGNGTVADTDGFSMALIHCATTAGWDRTGTYTIQASPDGGTTYKNLDLWDIDNGRALASSAITIVAAENRAFLVDLRGMDKLRVDVSVTVAGTTGTFTATSRALPVSNSVLEAMVQGADGAVVPPGTILIGGTDGTNLQSLSVDATGQVQTAHDANTNPIYVKITDGATEVVVETAGAKKALDVNITDGTNDQPTMDANTRAGFVEITDGTTEVGVTAGLTAAKVDIVGEGGAAITATNPVITELSDGAAVISSTNPLSVQLGDGTDQPNIHDATDTVIDDVATNDGLQTAALQYGYDDTGAAETWRATAVNAGGEIEIDISTQSLTALKISKDANANATANRMFTAANVDQLNGNTINVNGGAKDAGTQTTTLATDDPAVLALQIVDDWDEGDRAMVNPIVGQAGVAAGTGVDGVTVPRVSLATDVALPAGTNLLGKTGIDQTTPGTTNAVAAISGQAGIAGGAGAVGATVPRVTLASDDPAVTTLAKGFPDASNVSAGTQDTLTDAGGTNVYFGTLNVADASFRNMRLEIKVVTTTNESADNINVKWGFCTVDLGANCVTQLDGAAETGDFSLPNATTKYYPTIEVGRGAQQLHIWYTYTALAAGQTATLDIDVVKV